ncbi:MAG: uroporphyrinogen decarboxylase family protein [Victivallales bacterium]
MTGRERVYKAIRFEEPDRVPVDLGGTTGASGIHVIAYRNLKRHLGLPHRAVRSNDAMQQLAMIEPEIMDRLHVDVMQISTALIAENWHEYPLFQDLPVLFPLKLDLARESDGWMLKDNDGNLYLKPDSSLYFDSADGRHWFSTDLPLTDENLTTLQKRVKDIHASTEYALAGKFGGSFFESNPEFLMDLMTEQDKVAEVLARKCDALIEKIGRVNQAFGKYMFCVIFADDFGAQNAPLLSPDLFREMIVPHYRRFSSWLHANTDLKLYLHSCGAIMPLMDDIVGMGVDILNPIQTSATGMEPASLKAKYGRKIVFCGGGCDTQNVLGFKSKDELEEHVKERLRIFSPGGGFIFNQIHAIQANVDPESILAVFDTAHKFGNYK